MDLRGVKTVQLMTRYVGHIIAGNSSRTVPTNSPWQ